MSTASVEAGGGSTGISTIVGGDAGLTVSVSAASTIVESEEATTDKMSGKDFGKLAILDLTGADADEEVLCVTPDEKLELSVDVPTVSILEITLDDTLCEVLRETFDVKVEAFCVLSAATLDVVTASQFGTTPGATPGV